ncbi:MAG: hypothetical protein DRP11_00355 [Candidatus Aenigmatarchaeota archaeon]|nr:MAG: hypothetical protein DRP11_00355 [Candidatus Aenigmarchaeota archaeon]
MKVLRGSKGQTAMEYLMTYGWAILIILVVGGVLYYYGVFSPSTLVGESKTGFSKIDVVDWQWRASDDHLLIMLENRAGVDVNVTSIVVTYGTTTSTYTIPGGESISAGDRSSFIDATTTGIDFDSGDAYQIDVTINYYRTDSPATTLSSSGRLSGKAA